MPEVDAYFRKRAWFNASTGKASPPTYQFLTSEHGEVLGYASVAPRQHPHPHDQSDDKARYLTIYVTGIHTRFHGRENPSAPGETFAVSMFRVIDELARQCKGCIGVSLWVRANNARAIAFYEKVGFVADPGGPVQRDVKIPHLTMRKPL